MRTGLGDAVAAGAESRRPTGVRRAAGTVLVALLALAAAPGQAAAHGPVAPVATSYLARIGQVPAGLDAKVVDGYVRMWLSVPSTQTVLVLDYRGAPYLRFDRAGVQVNQNSSMYYLNQTPVAATPPADLNAHTPADWHQAGGGHSYEWHDGRLQALASVVLTPGTNYVGRWSIPLVVDGRRSAISGGLYHRDDPSIVWFWPIVVLLSCVLAAWRLRSVELDGRVARVLAIASLIAIAAADIARELHGRPGVSPTQWVELIVVAGFVAWGIRHVLFGRPNYFSYFVISTVALWEGLNLLPTLLHGYVLVALPPFLARVTTVLCLGCGISILWPAFRLADRRRDRAQETDDELGPDDLDADFAYEA
jgi:hypothetical protein